MDDGPLNVKSTGSASECQFEINVIGFIIVRNFDTTTTFLPLNLSPAYCANCTFLLMCACKYYHSYAVRDVLFLPWATEYAYAHVVWGSFCISVCFCLHTFLFMNLTLWCTTQAWLMLYVLFKHQWVSIWFVLCGHSGRNSDSIHLLRTQTV